jgi:hypothetical protein
MTLDLDQNEVQFILNVLGDLPAKTGVWPLIVKVQQQANAPAEVATIDPVQE